MNEGAPGPQPVGSFPLTGLGFDAGLTPCRPFLISDFPFVLSVRATISSHQQDLPDTALFCLCLSLGRVAWFQVLANRDNQLAIAHGFGHELKRFPVEF